MRLTGRAWGLAWSAILLFIFSSAALAEEAGDVSTYIISIKRLFESVEFEHALNQIQLARQTPHGTEEDVTLSLYEGIILAEQGKLDQCTGAFQAALLLRPDAKLPVMVSPKVAQHFESVRQKVKRELESALVKREAERQQAQAVPPDAALEKTMGRVPEKVPAAGSLRRYSLIPAIAGGALVVAGGASWAVSRGELNRLTQDAPGLTTKEDVQRSVSRGRRWQTVGVSLLGVGTAGLAAAAGFYFLGAPQGSVSLGLGTDGTSAIVYGRWP
jgi:hypothetical protein